jgi:hypothetical protein
MTGALERPSFANLMDRWLYRQGTTMAAGFQRALVAFDNGFRASWPAALMTRGPYMEAAGAFMPSIAF